MKSRKLISKYYLSTMHSIWLSILRYTLLRMLGQPSRTTSWLCFFEISNGGQLVKDCFSKRPVPQVHFYHLTGQRFSICIHWCDYSLVYRDLLWPHFSLVIQLIVHLLNHIYMSKATTTVRATCQLWVQLKCVSGRLTSLTLSSPFDRDGRMTATHYHHKKFSMPCWHCRNSGHASILKEAT